VSIVTATLVVAIVTLREYDKISYHMDEKLLRRKDETIATNVQKKGGVEGPPSTQIPSSICYD
jgi:hypothetical protein